MKILMISDVYFPRVNGVSSSIHTFRNELKQLGHHVTLIAPAYYEETEDEENIIRIPARTVVFDPEDRLMRMGKIMQLTKILRKEEFDIIHIQTPFVAHYAGLRLARRLRIPKVVSYHTFFEEYLYHYLPFFPKHMMRVLARRFSRRQCNSVDNIIAPSHAMLKTLRKYGVKKSAHILPTGIEPSRFSHGDGKVFREKYGIAADRPLLVFVGRVAYEKNIDFLIYVLKEVKLHHPDILFAIAGEGPAEMHIKHLAERQGVIDNVLFLGYLDRKTQIQDLYSAGNVFVFSSFTETQGLVLLEAMAMGLPIVSTSIMGTKDILTAEKGVLIAKEEIPDFSHKVNLLLNNPMLWYKLHHEGKNYAQTWSSHEMAKRLITIYEETIENYPKKRRFLSRK